MRRRQVVLAWTLALVLAATVPAEAYIGPGAGFALLSSFFVLLTTVVVAIASLLVWPFRALWRLLTREDARRAPRIERLIVVGLDGQDPEAHRSVHAGRAAAELQAAGAQRAATAGCARPSRRSRRWRGRRSAPARIPARHNIFDFLDRDRRTYLPMLSSTRIGKVRAVPQARPLPDSARTARAAAAAASRSRSGRSSASTASGARSCACRSRFRPTVSTARS